MEKIGNNLTVVLPTLNEEQTIGPVIDEIRSLPVRCEILVVDGNSTDNTYNVAFHKNAMVVTEPARGKGMAMRKGFQLVNSPYVIMMDSDFTYPAIYIPEIYKLLTMGRDVVIGYRKWKEKGSMSFTHSIGNKFLSLLASVLYGQKINDVCSGMWGFRKEALDTIYLRSQGFTLEAELFTKSIKHKYMISQIPIVYRARPHGSKVKLKISDGFKIGWFLIKERWRR